MKKQEQDHIKELRKDVLGLSQVDFGRILGVGQSTVAKWETGRESVTSSVRGEAAERVGFLIDLAADSHMRSALARAAEERGGLEAIASLLGLGVACFRFNPEGEFERARGNIPLPAGFEKSVYVLVRLLGDLVGKAGDRSTTARAGDCTSPGFEFNLLLFFKELEELWTRYKFSPLLESYAQSELEAQCETKLKCKK